MITFSITVTGIDDVLTALTNVGVDVPKVLGRALYQEGLALAAEADALVPRDTGNLAASQFVTPPSGVPVQVVVGYGGAAAPYALAVHENPRSGRTGGVSPQGKAYKHFARVGQWKYLETPFKARTAGFSDRLGVHLKRYLERGR